MATYQDFDPKEIHKIHLISPHSHKGDNARVLVIGGSSLFYSASIWAAELIAHFADHVFYYSPAHINRDVLVQSKSQFKDGFIVVAQDLEEYVKEADVILIGPGLRRRDTRTPMSYQAFLPKISEIENITDEGELSYILTNALIHKYPTKKWVVDAGALQEIELENITDTCILTPHQQELSRLFPQLSEVNLDSPDAVLTFLETMKKTTQGTWLFKNRGTDYVATIDQKIVRIVGGNEGLVKGGTGDLLAALVAAFYAKNSADISAGCASYMLKQAADKLFITHGPYYTTTQLMQYIPQVYWQLLSESKG